RAVDVLGLVALGLTVDMPPSELSGGMKRLVSISCFLNNPATTVFYTLSLHDALPICRLAAAPRAQLAAWRRGLRGGTHRLRRARSEEHTSELQSLAYLVCRLLLEKKKTFEPAITFQNVWVAFAERRVLQGLSFQVWAR